MSAYKPRSQRKTKGLSTDGSTRSWRKARAAALKRAGVLGKPGYEVDHIKPRRSGGTDTPSNLRVVRAKNNRPGRPRGS